MNGDLLFASGQFLIGGMLVFNSWRYIKNGNKLMAAFLFLVGVFLIVANIHGLVTASPRPRY